MTRKQPLLLLLPLISLALFYCAFTLMYRWWSWHFVEPFFNSLVALALLPVVAVVLSIAAAILDAFGLKGSPAESKADRKRH